MSYVHLLTRYLFNPIWPIMLYLFMSITTLHMQLPFLLTIHFEGIVLIACILNTVFYILVHKNEKMNYKHPIFIPILLGHLFIITPILTSFINNDMLSILKNEEYKDLFKMIIFGPILYLFLSKNQYRNLILNSIIISYLLFGIYFLYRFFVLHEARDFDLRPSLKIRHGDANFLCTFFSILIPISLMQAKNYFHKKEYILLSLFLSIGIFLSICTLLTESRMGIIATAIGMIYIFTRPIIRFNKITSLFIIFVSSGIYIFYKGEHILLRYADIQDKSNTDRYLTWKNGWQVFTDNPVFGAGMHKAKDFFYKNTAYPAFQSEFHPLEIHNTFLKTAAELGISGLIFFSLLFLWPWKKSLKCRSDDRYFLICSMTILTLSILTIGLVYKDLFMLHLFIIAALATSPAPEFKN